MCISVNKEELEFLKNTIKSIPDYPKKGILFRDITSLIEEPSAFSMVINMLAEHYKNKGITKIVGTEARGFIFAAPLSIALNVGFVPIRKPGKLPRAVLQEEYELEYGTDKLEIHQDAIAVGDKVLVIDDLLATGGTAVASVNLVRRLGGTVEHAGFVISLPALNGEQHLLDIGITPFSLMHFSGS